MGVGASAGGLEAFTELLEHLPTNTGMAFVLVQHLAPTHVSVLTNLLSRTTALPVQEARNNLPLKPDHVYVIPPDTKMTMAGGVLKLVKRRRETGALHSIDYFLESLARNRGPQAIGVILSGSASDGTRGVEAIKNEGGITLAQDRSAKYVSMPQSAIASGCVDFVLSPAKIGEELGRLARHPHLTPAGPNRDVSAAIPRDDYGKILQIVRMRTGVDFSLYKSATIQRRVSRRMVLCKSPRLPAYLDYLREHGEEVEALYQDLLINVTEFFRNPETFETLKQKVFPALIKARTADQPVRVWVVGCSTGQEAYSIAMVFMEFASQAGTQAGLQIFASDLNDALLEKARAGLYSKTQVGDVSPSRLRRFFVEEEGGYRICKSIRELCVFAKHDALSDPPFSRMDLLSCRNVMIYLEPVLQKRLLPIFHYALKPGGFLLLGSSETIGGFAELFVAFDKAHRLYARKTTTHHPPATLQRSTGLDLGVRGQRPPATTEAHALESDAQREADRILLAKYAPASVLVDENLMALQFRGHTGLFLEIPAGRATCHLPKMLREGLLLPVRNAIQTAKRSGEAIRREHIEFRYDDEQRVANLEIIPVRNIKERWFLVLFEQVPARGPSRSRNAPAPAREPPLPRDLQDALRENARLRSELTAARDYLQSTSEQYEAANEELQASNQEAQSSNEELQSINEELETTKEELQSTNEELTTVNEEMGTRNVELHRINSDLNNVLSGVQMCIVVLSSDLSIRRFTPLAEKVLNLLPTDVGRPITDIRPNFDFPDLEQVILEVISSVRPQESEVRDREGRWYSLRIFPYKTLDNRIDGAVLVLVDIEALKRGEQRVRAALDYAESMIETVREPLLVLNSSLQIERASRSFYLLFHAAPADVQGQFLNQIDNRQWNIPQLCSLLQEVLSRNAVFNDFEVERDFARLGHRSMLLNARPIAGETGRPQRILLAIEDVTERKQLEVIRQSEERFRTLAEALPHLVWTSTPDGNCDYFNSKWTEYTGVPVPGLLGLQWREKAVHPVDAERTYQPWCAALKGQAQYDLEFRIRRADGEYHWFKARATPLHDQAGRIVKWFGTCTDIEDQMQAQRRIEESARRLKLLSDTAVQLLSSDDPPATIGVILEQLRRQVEVDVGLIYLVKESGDSLWLQSHIGISEAEGEEISALRLGEAVCGRVAAERHARVVANVQESDDALLERVKRFKVRAYACQPLLAGDRVLGTLSFGSRAKNAFSAEDLEFFHTLASYVALAFDRWRLLKEATQRALDLEARVNERTAELRDMIHELEAFSYSISHDLRSPLRAMTGFAHLTLQECGEQLPPRVKDYLDRIINGANRADRLIQDVLTYSRVSRADLNLTPIDLERLLREVIPQYPTLQPPGTEIQIQSPLRPVMAHEASLVQCITNLLSNATKFMAPGTVPRIKIWTEPVDGEVRIFFEDNGIGIEPANLGRIFGMFERVHSTQEYEGTGIGLAIVRKSVERMGGTVGVESEPGKGSRFWIQLKGADE